jgi:hypothetical protein
MAESREVRNREAPCGSRATRAEARQTSECVRLEEARVFLARACGRSKIGRCV